MSLIRELIAHVRKVEESGEWDLPHRLEDHLNGVTIIAENAAKSFGQEKNARILGLTHDAGKASFEFQKKIRMVSGYEAQDFNNEVVPDAPHSDAGAQFVVSRYGTLGKILAYCITGHHGGMPNGMDDTEACLSKRLKREVNPYLKSYQSLQLSLPSDLLPGDFVKRQNTDGFTISFLIRMLFSSLVDADFLDTESYMSPRTADNRAGKHDFSTLLHKLNAFIEKISAKGKDSPIAEARGEILADCRKSAENAPGYFSLTVPTGGGKTLSSLAFALTHAVKFQKERVIYTIPFTSIIEQNAKVFRDAVGDDAILEHHSSIDPEDRTYKNKLAAENWDAPIVVTTNVQLFESLFAYKPSKCRKLHNIANSVIVIDEAQMLSPDYLRPTLRAMSELVEGYGCTIVLCTATQPALNRSDDFDEGLTNVKEIISNPAQLYKRFKRVKVNTVDVPLSLQELGKQLQNFEQVLCIVNRRKDAFSLFRQMEELEGVFHLSTHMCAAHRTEVFSEIRKRLQEGRTCRVISTQLIEAGVDVDFPVVYRAEAGIDSIAQSAGRCNREGKREKGGLVCVFRLEERPPAGMLRQSADEGNKAIRLHSDDILSLESVKDYFKSFYWKRQGANGLDKKEILGAVNEDFNPNLNFPFREISKAYCLIANNTCGVAVPWGEGRSLCNRLINMKDAERSHLRKVQRYLVQVRKEVRDELILTGSVLDIFGDESLYVLTNERLYDSKVGLNTEKSIAYDTAALIV